MQNSNTGLYLLGSYYQLRLVDGEWRDKAGKKWTLPTFLNRELRKTLGKDVSHTGNSDLFDKIQCQWDLHPVNSPDTPG